MRENYGKITFVDVSEHINAVSAVNLPGLIMSAAPVQEIDIPAGDLIEQTSEYAFKVLCGDSHRPMTRIRAVITSFLESGIRIADAIFANAKPASSDAYKYAFAKFRFAGGGYSVAASIQFACMESPVGALRPIVYVMGADVSCLAENFLEIP